MLLPTRPVDSYTAVNPVLALMFPKLGFATVHTSGSANAIFVLAVLAVNVAVARVPFSVEEAGVTVITLSAVSVVSQPTSDATANTAATRIPNLQTLLLFISVLLCLLARFSNAKSIACLRPLCKLV